MLGPASAALESIAVSPSGAGAAPEANGPRGTGESVGGRAAPLLSWDDITTSALSGGSGDGGRAPWLSWDDMTTSALSGGGGDGGSPNLGRCRKGGYASGHGSRELDEREKRFE